MKILGLTITEPAWEITKKAGDSGYSIIGDVGLDEFGVSSGIDVAYVFSKGANPIECYGNARLIQQAPEMALVFKRIQEDLNSGDTLSAQTRAAIRYVLNDLNGDN